MKAESYFLNPKPNNYKSFKRMTFECLGCGFLGPMREDTVC